MQHKKTLCKYTAMMMLMMLLFSVLPLSALATNAEDILAALPDPVKWTDPNDPDNPYPYGLPVDTIYPAEFNDAATFALTPRAQGRIPDEMWDNSILRALEYTGYDVQWLKDNNKLYTSQYIASSLKNNRPSVLSDIGYYSSGACPNGDETVNDSSTVTGKAPKISYFENNGMVCASFVTYYLCNYLPNIEGVDTSVLYEKAKAVGADPDHKGVYYLTTVTLWKNVLDYFSSKADGGVTKYTDAKTAYKNLVPGDVIVFANDGKLVHIGIYAGEYDLYSNGYSMGVYHFLIHVGNSRGPEINTVEYMASSGSKASTPIAWYHLEFNDADVPTSGYIEVKKEDENSNALAGAVFTAENNSTGERFTIGPTNANGYAKSTEIPFGTYVVTETAFPEGYAASGQTSWTVTLDENTPEQTISIRAVNTLKKWRVTVTKKDSETGTARADATLDGAVYGLYKDGALLKQHTVKNGTFTTDSYPCGTGYTLKEISAPKGYQLNTTVYNLDDYSASGKCTDPLTTAQVTVTEDIITGQIKIIKRTLNPVDNATAPENGAVFRYWLKSAGSYDSCPDNLKGTMTTGADGVAVSTKLPYGTYVVEQISGAEGTDLVPSFEAAVTETGKIYTYTKDNPYWTGTVSILKVEEETNTPLIAKFNLLDANQNVLESKSTDMDGTVSFTTKLVYGKTYYLQEAEAPTGYILDDTLHVVTVTEPEQKITKKLVNFPDMGSIALEKMSISGEPLAGVKFRLDYSTDGQSWTPVTKRDEGSAVTLGGCTSEGLTDGCLITDGRGLLVFSGLRISNQNSKVYYRLIECASADGYTMMTEPAYEGELPLDGSNHITITAINSHVFELPHTGNPGMITVPFGVMMLCIAGCMVFSFVPVYRRKED